MLAGASLFEDVVKGICGTNTTWRQAVACINRLAELGRARRVPRAGRPAARRRGPPARRRARVGYRAPAITAAARAAIDGTLADIEADSAAGDADRVYAGLLALPGIGPATAGFIILLMGHYDRPSIDSATIRVRRDRWFDGDRPTPREVVARIAPAGDFAGLVLAWATLRAWQRETGAAQPRGSARGRRTRASRARQRRAQASQVQLRREARRPRPAEHRRAGDGSAASRESWRE